MIKDNEYIIKLDTGLDLSGFLTFKIGYKSPSEVIGQWDAEVDSGSIIKTTTEQVFDESGYWDLWSIVDNSIGNPLRIVIYPQPSTEQSRIVDYIFVKSYLGLNNDYDFKIKALIPLVENDYLRIRNAPFKEDSNGNYIYPPGASVIAAEMIKYKLKDFDNQVQSIRIGNFSETYKEQKDYPKHITNSIKKYILIGDKEIARFQEQLWG